MHSAKISKKDIIDAQVAETPQKFRSKFHYQNATHTLLDAFLITMPTTTMLWKVVVNAFQLNIRSALPAILCFEWSKPHTTFQSAQF